MPRDPRDLIRGILPEQEAIVRVESVEERESLSGIPRLVFTGTVLAGKSAGETVRWSRSLSSKALWKITSDLIASGINFMLTDNPEEDPDVLKSVSRKLIGLPLRVRITVFKRINGGRYNDVDVLGPSSGLAMDVQDTEEVRGGAPKPVGLDEL